MLSYFTTNFPKLPSVRLKKYTPFAHDLTSTLNDVPSNANLPTDFPLISVMLSSAFDKPVRDVKRISFVAGSGDTCSVAFPDFPLIGVTPDSIPP